MTEEQRATINKKQLAELHPAMHPKVAAVLKDLAGHGWLPYIADAWRSPDEQLRKFKVGHSKVRWGFHNATAPDGTPEALAADIVDARWGWDSPEKFWEQLGSSVKAHGMTWGGSWKTFVDKAHVQFYPNSELKAVKAGKRP